MARDKHKVAENVDGHIKKKEIIENHPTIASLATLFLQKGERDLQVATANFDVGKSVARAKEFVLAKMLSGTLLDKTASHYVESSTLCIVPDSSLQNRKNSELPKRLFLPKVKGCHVANNAWVKISPLADEHGFESTCVHEIVHLQNRAATGQDMFDAAIELANENQIPIILIPSRRQVECKSLGGGYVMDTEDFVPYVRTRDKGSYIFIERDHGGVYQGTNESKLDLETNELINHYDKKYGKGRDYAYIYPAIIKTLQNAGRCIRSETDKGIVVFLDERYSWPNYRNCFPKDKHFITTRLPLDKIREFFKN